MRLVNRNNLEEIAHVIKQGGIVVFPTETSYGLGCDAANQEAVDKIFRIKGRKSDKPLLVVVPSVEMAKKYMEWNGLLDRIARKYWPGAVTVVGKCVSLRDPHNAGRGNPSDKRPANLVGTSEHKDCFAPPIVGSRNDTLAQGVVSQDNTIALRVTAFPLLVELTSKLGRPIVATSANIAEAGDMYDAKDVIQMFEKQKFQPDVILEYGILPKNPPTTVVSVVEGEVRVLREGEIKV